MLTIAVALSLQASEDLGHLVRARLDLARPVALAKLYSRAPIEDRGRERAVLDDVRRRAPGFGLDPDRAVRFFAAQIEASKAAQRAWQAQWAREGAPFDPRPNLARDVRPKLDRLTPKMLEALRKGSAKDLARKAPKEPWLRPAWATATAPLTR